MKALNIGTINITATQAARFWSRVRIGKPDDCWEWQRAIRGGYGRISLKDKSFRTNRIAFYLTNGKFDYSLDVLHTCDNPLCCNPKHLFLGTDKDNHTDRNAKGRGNIPSGEMNGQAKLMLEQVLSIRAKSARGESNVSIARVFGVSKANIFLIVNRKRWAHV